MRGSMELSVRLVVALLYHEISLEIRRDVLDLIVTDRVHMLCERVYLSGRLHRLKLLPIIEASG